MRLFSRGLKAEMTLGVVIMIVLGLIVIAVMGYIFWGKSKNLSSATSCDASDCTVTGAAGCPSGKIPSFTTCKKTVGKETKTGRCCVSDQ